MRFSKMLIRTVCAVFLPIIILMGTAYYYQVMTNDTAAALRVSSIKTCQPHLDVAFMKVHKCGSTLISDIIFRFGYEHNLTVALPSKRGREIIGGFGTIKNDDYEHPPDGKLWNIFAHHAMYNRTRFRQLMAPNTRYVAILREPLRRLKSAFQYFNLERGFPGLQGQTPKGIAPITTYLSRPSFWDQQYKPSSNVKAREHYCFRNCMSRDLGFEEKDYDNHTAIKEFVRGIENDFTIVLIFEYLQESLILLKRSMCWTFYDILYPAQGGPKRQTYRGKVVITEATERLFYEHNFADLMLYKRFKETFHQQIQQQSADFQEEVDHFGRVNQKVFSFCRSEKMRQGLQMIVGKSRWNDAFTVNQSLCETYGRHRKFWDTALRPRYGHTDVRKNG